MFHAIPRMLNTLLLPILATVPRLNIACSPAIETRMQLEQACLDDSHGAGVFVVVVLYIRGTKARLQLSHALLLLARQAMNHREPTNTSKDPLDPIPKSPAPKGDYGSKS